MMREMLLLLNVFTSQTGFDKSFDVWKMSLISLEYGMIGKACEDCSRDLVRD